MVAIDKLLAIIVVTLGFFTIGCWLFLQEAWHPIHPSFFVMSFNTALCFVFAGMLFLLQDKPFHYHRILKNTLSLILVVFASATIAQDIFGTSFGLDEFFVTVKINDYNPHAGRMAPQTALGFILTGLILFLIHHCTKKRVNYLIQILILGLMLVGILGLVGYALKLELLYHWYKFVRMEVPTAVFFILLAVAFWISWYQCAVKNNFFLSEEDKRINTLAVAILTGIVLLTGVASFSVLGKQTEDTIQDKFETLLKTRAIIIQKDLTHAIGDMHNTLKQLQLDRSIADLNTNPNNAIALTTLQTNAQHYGKYGITSIELITLDGKHIPIIGEAINKPAVAFKLGNGGQLLWKNNTHLRVQSDIVNGDQHFGTLAIERAIPEIDNIFDEDEYFDENPGVLLCGAVPENKIECLFKQHLAEKSDSIKIINRGSFPEERTGTRLNHDASQHQIIETYSAVGEFPLYIAMNVNTSDIYGPLREKLGVILCLLLTLLLGGILLLRSQVSPLIIRLIRLEREAQASKSRIRAIIASTTDGIITVNEQHCIDSINPAACKLFGYDLDDLVHQSVAILVPERLQNPYHHAVKHFLQDSSPDQVRKWTLDLLVKHKDGHEFVVYLGISEMWLGTEHYFVCNLNDITEKKVKEEQLIESEARYARAISAAKDGIWDWDIATGKFYRSPGYLQLANNAEVEPFETVEQAWKVIHPDDVKYLQEATARHFKENTHFQVEFRMRDKNGDYHWFENKAQATRDKQGNPIRMTGRITDISDRKKTEQEKSAFVSQLSHLLRTPLKTMRNHLWLANVESDSLSAQTKNNIDMAYQESEKILSLVNDVLDIEKIESELAQSAPIWIYLKECIELAIKECNPDAQKYNVSFTIKEPIVKISIFVDVLRLVQVMTNLLSNASKYSPPHSNIIITTVDQDDFVRVSITDRGPGISEKDRAHLFEKFPQAYNTEQNEKSGTGLGLHICKTIIEQLGGNIGFEPGALQGTTFYFDLPKTLADPRIESSAGFSAT